MNNALGPGFGFNANAFPAAFPPGAANNGLSVDPVSKKIVLGNSEVFTPGDAALLSNREIWLNNFFIFLRDTIAGQNSETSIGAFQINVGRAFPNANSLSLFGDNTGARLVVNAVDAGSNPPEIQMQNTADSVSIFAQIGSIFQLQDAMLEFFSVSRANGLKVTGDTTMIHSGTAYANGAAAAAGTLNNAPAAGNPTKWIPIDDNGTTRFIPAW